MAAAQPSILAPTASARASFNQRLPHSWEGPDPTDESEEEQQGAAHASPVARLYRHALESIFAFLPFADLSRVLCVNRSWSASVLSMQSIGRSLLTLRPPHVIAASSLAHHVGELQVRHLSSSDLFVLSRHLPSLTSLSCTVELAHAPRVYFASTLQSLSLTLEGDASRTPLFNDAIVTISRLPTLTDLRLWLSEFFPALSFASLATAARLQKLNVLCDDTMPATLTLHQLDQLRRLPRLRKMSIALSNDSLAYLLRPPHSLQWQEIHTARDIDDAAAVALSALPSLTALETLYQRSSVAFLSSLPRLRSLQLWMDEGARLAADIATGLSRCSQLTDLTLQAADVTSRHLSQALSPLLLLRKLSVHRCPALESLSFLSECRGLAQSLRSLDLRQCRNAALHCTDLKHILSLATLMSLCIRQSFAKPLDDCARRLLTPPSVALPMLEAFEYAR